MKGALSIYSDHLSGEQPGVVADEPPLPADVDSWAGTVRVEWDRETSATSLGQLPFFIDFLKTSGLFDGFVSDCPLAYASPNAPKKRDLLGTAMLRCWPATGVTRIFRRCGSMACCPSCSV
jgi:hypothetical protein